MIHGKAPAGWEGPQPCEDRIATLEAALRDALEGMMDMRGYVGDYFADKWDHDGYIARARAVLEHRP